MKNSRNLINCNILACNVSNRPQQNFLLLLFNELKKKQLHGRFTETGAFALSFHAKTKRVWGLHPLPKNMFCPY